LNAGFGGNGNVMTLRHARASRAWTVSALVLLLTACAGFPQARLELQTPDRRAPSDAAAPSVAADSSARAKPAEPNGTFYKPGSDRLLGLSLSSGVTRPSRAVAGGPVTLNFENTNLLEVVKVVLGDLLKRNYLIDPLVRGSVTLHSSTPIEREDLLATLSLLLHMNNAVVIERGEVLHVVPRERAGQGLVTPQLGDIKTPLPSGFGVRVVPLRFIGAQEMRTILEPLSTPGNVVRVDSLRNLLILSGSGGELSQLMETIKLFDVDWMAGMSVALFRPDFVPAKTLAEELEQILDSGADGALAGAVRFIVIERLNGLLVVTPRREYLARVRQWVQRLDLADAGVGERLFVYHVQNGKAVELAQVLAQVFGEQQAAAASRPEIAPGLEPARVSSQSANTGNRSANPTNTAPGATPGTIGAAGNVGGDATNNGGNNSVASDAPAAVAAANGGPAATANLPDSRASVVPTPGEGLVVSQNQRIRIIADEVNNALLIMARASEYRQVEAALKQLDIAPLQVLIEATIAEVRLEDQLSQGMEWFFKNNVGSRGATSSLDLNDVAGLAAVVPGFSFAITDSASAVRAVLNALATESRAKIISSPSLMVLNNQTATIQVGDQVPITTQQQQATTTTSNIVNSIEFRDTGVLLTVTPRVNAGGLVTMEIEQEVSNVAASANSSLTPTIQQRKISSTVAVQSGETVVLGGLIRENDNTSGSGVPGLREVPILGWFFGASTDQITRTELVVLITPRAVRGAVEAREVTDEFREKMDSLKPNTSPRRGFGPLYHRTDKLRNSIQDSIQGSSSDVLPQPASTHGLSATGAAPPAALVYEHKKRMKRVLIPGRPSRPSAMEPESVDLQTPGSLALARVMAPWSLVSL
jgi:general secretion pathway protein D